MAITSRMQEKYPIEEQEKMLRKRETVELHTEIAANEMQQKLSMFKRLNWQCFEPCTV